MAKRSDTTRSIVISLAANIAIALVKLAAAVLTGSGSMLAEALHSTADTGNEALLLLGRHQAKARPTVTHPLGQGRATYFWSFVVALLLFSMGGVASMYEGIRKIGAAERLQSPWVAIAILLFAAAAEGISLYVALRQINKLRGDATLWRWFRVTRRSELIIVFGENAAALLGLLIALIAVVLTMLTGNPVYDAAGSVAIGVLLVVVALAMGHETKSLLIGESAAPKVRHAIRKFLSECSEIRAITELITLQHGEEILVAVKARMNATTAEDLIAASDSCEAGLKSAFPEIKWVFFQPRLDR